MSDIGEVIGGRYRLQRCLGSGGMGIVYLAQDLESDLPVAVKMLRSTVIESEEARTRLTREIRTLSLLRSPYVAELYSAGYLDDGSPYFVMEYLEGRDLKSEIRARGPLPVAEAAAYLVQACRGIAAAHQRDIVHRDLKPHNMILTNLQSVRQLKIVDFGVAKLLNSADPNLTASDAAIGTPLYMCPEQLLDTKMVTTKADVWALGVVLYELLAGFPPFLDDSAGAVIAAVTLDEPVPMRELRSDVPEGVGHLLDAALRKSPVHRLASALEFEELLLPYATPLDALVVPQAAYEETKPAFERPTRTRRESILRKQIEDAVDGSAQADRDTVPYLRTSPSARGSTPAVERLSLLPSLRHISVRPLTDEARSAFASRAAASATAAPLAAAHAERPSRLIRGVGLVAILTLVFGIWLSRRANGLQAPSGGAPLAVDRDRDAPNTVPAAAERPAITRLPTSSYLDAAPRAGKTSPAMAPTSGNVRSGARTKVPGPTAPPRPVASTAATAKVAVPLHL